MIPPSAVLQGISWDLAVDLVINVPLRGITGHILGAHGVFKHSFYPLRSGGVRIKCSQVISAL